MLRFSGLLFCSLMLLSAPAWAVGFGQTVLDPSLPVYRPVSTLQGELKLVGSNTMSHVAQVWATGFRRFYPDVRLSIDIQGSRKAVTGVREGTAHVGLLSRTIHETEAADFRKTFGYEPKVLTPCLERIAIYVHKDNPIRGLTLPQVDAIFSTTRKRGGPKPVLTWGELGLTGKWASQPIVVHGRAEDTGSQVFFQEAVLLGGKFRDDLKAYPNNLKMVLATAQDPRAIGFAGLSFAMPDVRAVPLAFDSRSPFVAINSTAADAGRYPLVRPLQLVVNHATKKELRPVEQEFIKYVFSRRGQEDVIKAGLEVTPVQAVHIALDSVGLGVAR